MNSGSGRRRSAGGRDGSLKVTVEIGGDVVDVADLKAC